VDNQLSRESRILDLGSPDQSGCAADSANQADSLDKTHVPRLPLFQVGRLDVSCQIRLQMNRGIAVSNALPRVGVSASCLVISQCFFYAQREKKIERERERERERCIYHMRSRLPGDRLYQLASRAHLRVQFSARGGRESRDKPILA
jgi:hypothetical protein